MPQKFVRFFRRPTLLLQVWRYRLLFWAGAIMVAVAAMAFAAAANWAHVGFNRLLAIHPLVILVTTPAGFALVLWLTRRVFEGAEGSGIPQSIAALSLPELAQRRSVLSLRVATGKIMLTGLGLCFGASVGREGPTVQIGAAILHSLSKWLTLPVHALERSLILAGGAAGVAAAFNTPLAGIVFAIEELSRSFEERASGTVLTAVIISGLASMAVTGNYAYFGHTDATLAASQVALPVVVCGVVGGVLGGLFARILITFSRGIGGRAGAWIAANPIRFAALCGLSLAVLGLSTGVPVFGTGYEEARGLVEGTHPLSPAFGPLKLLATVLSYISGIPGGIFAPSLAVGAGLGADSLR